MNTRQAHFHPNLDEPCAHGSPAARSDWLMVACLVVLVAVLFVEVAIIASLLA